MTGAEVLVARLIAHGTDVVFGLPGEENLAVVDAGVDLVVTRHGQHAAFMAAAHGRLTGSPGVCAPARAIGASAHRVEAADDLEAVLIAALAEPGVSLVDCRIDYSLNELLSTDLYACALEEISAS